MAEGPEQQERQSTVTWSTPQLTRSDREDAKFCGSYQLHTALHLLKTPTPAAVCHCTVAIQTFRQLGLVQPLPATPFSFPHGSVQTHNAPVSTQHSTANINLPDSPCNKRTVLATQYRHFI